LEKSNKGPVVSQTRIMERAAAKAQGDPIIRDAILANFLKISFIYVSIFRIASRSLYV